MAKKIILILFALVTIGELLSVLLSLPAWEMVCKPLIMVTLGAYFIVAHRQEVLSRTVMAAIFFSFLGDVLLMFDKEAPLYFMLGLGAFLIAQVCYIFSYKQFRQEGQHNELQGVQRIRFAFPIVLAGTGLIVVLYPVLGDMRFPVLVYAAALVLMVLNALFRFGRTNTASFWMVFTGAILFMMSDSLIAINKFLGPVTQAGFWIMSTYCLAQYLIVAGLARHRE